MVFETRLLTANKQRLLLGTSVCPGTVSWGFKDGAVVCRPPAVTTEEEVVRLENVLFKGIGSVLFDRHNRALL